MLPLRFAESLEHDPEKWVPVFGIMLRQSIAAKKRAPGRDSGSEPLSRHREARSGMRSRAGEADAQK
jgi:hypothetical protein